MGQNKINGGSQIQSGTIPLTALISSFQLPSSMLVDGGNFLKRDGSIQLTGSLNLGGNILSNSGQPVAQNDLATKAYVDSRVGGLTVHPAVRLVVDSNISVSSPGTTFDSVIAQNGDRLFLINQTDRTQNGPWVYNGSNLNLTRPSDWITSSIQSEGAYWISDPDGNVYKNTKWFTNNVSYITVDNTAVTFTEDQTGAAYSGANGVQVIGSTISLNMTSNSGLVVNNNQVFVSADNSRGLQVSASGVGIADGASAGLLALTNVSNHFNWVALSGDATISNTGALTINTSAGSGFVKYSAFVFNETLSGSLNGANVNFNLANTPAGNALVLTLNGEYLIPGASNDYTISGNAITMNYPPQVSDSLLAMFYMH